MPFLWPLPHVRTRVHIPISTWGCRAPHNTTEWDEESKVTLRKVSPTAILRIYESIFLIVIFILKTFLKEFICESLFFFKAKRQQNLSVFVCAFSFLLPVLGFIASPKTETALQTSVCRPGVLVLSVPSDPSLILKQTEKAAHPRGERAFLWDVDIKATIFRTYLWSSSLRPYLQA